MTTTQNIVLFSIFMIGLIFLFRLLCFRKKKSFLLKLLYISILFLISVFCYYLRIYLLSRLSLHLTDLFSFLVVFSVVSGSSGAASSEAEGLNQAPLDPNTGMAIYKAHSPGARVEVFEIPATPHSGASEAAPTHSPEPEAAPPSPNVAPYPYDLEQVIGGDSVSSIQRRLLDQMRTPDYTYEVSQRTLYEAQDRFELKVKILTKMSEFDPNGAWLERGARTLDNPRTKTGEPSVEQLGSILEELQIGGPQSPVFRTLMARMR